MRDLLTVKQHICVRILFLQGFYFREFMSSTLLVKLKPLRKGKNKALAKFDTREKILLYSILCWLPGSNEVYKMNVWFCLLTWLASLLRQTGCVHCLPNMHSCPSEHHQVLFCKINNFIYSPVLELIYCIWLFVSRCLYMIFLIFSNV